jgi:hypothetical protein
MTNGLADMEFHHFSSQQPFQAASSPSAGPWNILPTSKNDGSKPTENGGRGGPTASQKIADQYRAGGGGRQNREEVQKIGGKSQMNGGKIQNGVSSRLATCVSGQDNNGRVESAVGWLGGGRGSQSQYTGNRLD